MGKPVTTSDIAKLAGVSRTTVSYVLNDAPGKTISKPVREKILKIAQELDYKPNPFARGLKTKSAKTIALVLPNITDPSLSILIKGIETASNFDEFSLIVHDNDVKNRKKIDDIELLCEKAIDGIIYAYPEEDDELIIKHLIEKRKIATVVVGSKFYDLKCNYIGVDSIAVGKDLAEYLYKSGHEKIAIISGTLTKSRKQRIEGFQSVYKKVGIDPDMIICETIQNTRSIFYDTREYDIGYEAAKKILNNEKYTAVFCVTEGIAIGLINALKSKGIQIPKDISIAAFGGNFISELIEPKLTLMQNPTFDIGKRAFEMLKSTLDNPAVNAYHDIIFHASLKEGESVISIKNHKNKGKINV